MLQYYHWPIVQKTRNAIRKIGLLQPLKKVLAKFQKDYEERFAKELINSIQPGYTVWDIGANVGFYTIQFAERTGNSGTVIAFEPQEEAVAKINDKLKSNGLENCQVIKCALSDFEGEAAFSNSGVEANTTGSLVDVEKTDSEHSLTLVTKVDSALGQFQLALPNVTKIDVEGYEIEVLRGGQQVFSSKESRHIFVEVHFTRLDQRGFKNPGQEIRDYLTNWGYKTAWTDASHIHAWRT